MEPRQSSRSNPQAAESELVASIPVRAVVRSLGWEGTREQPELVAWVRCWRDDEEWGLRYQILPSLEVAPVSEVGRPEVRFAGYAAVERYLGENPAELEWLLKFAPGTARRIPTSGS